MTLAELKANFPQAVANVYQYEGGFENDKADTGNFYNGQLIGTNLGITPAAYKAYYKSDPTVAIIKGLTKTKASPIYKTNYWDKIRGDELANDSVANLMLDVVVNSGTGMIKSFKQLANQVAGKTIMALTTTPFTPTEVKLINALPQDQYFKAIKDFRTSFYKALVQKDPVKQKFLKGWLSRLDKHTYSGKTSVNKKRLIVIGLSALAVGGAAWYFRKDLKGLL